MGLLFVGGVMNLLWIAGLAIYVLLEKLAPFGPALARISGAILLLGGAAILAACNRASNTCPCRPGRKAGTHPSARLVNPYRIPTPTPLPGHARSNRSRFITLVQAATKSLTNFLPASAHA